MDLEWDEPKRRANITKHGIDFVAAAKIFDGPLLERMDERRAYGERRIQALGDLDGRILHVVYTWRGDNRRMISARRARRDERRDYYESIEQAARNDEG